MEWIIVVALIVVMLSGFWLMKKVDEFRTALRKREKMDDDDE